MILYLDTSVLVAALTHAAETARMQRWLDDQAPELLAISDWVTAEFSSALSIKLRSGQIEMQHRADALAMFTTMSADTFTVLPISAAQFRTAARFADQHTRSISGPVTRSCAAPRSHRCSALLALGEHRVSDRANLRSHGQQSAYEG